MPALLKAFSPLLYFRRSFVDVRRSENENHQIRSSVVTYVDYSCTYCINQLINKVQYDTSSITNGSITAISFANRVTFLF